MIIDTIENLQPLVPLDAFSVSSKLSYCREEPSLKWLKKNGVLPHLEEFLLEESFAQVACGWNQKGLYFAAFVEKPFEEAFYPRFYEGDALELFIDTRSLKEVRFMSAFCHRFVFLPVSVQGIQAQEITQFRSEESHPLCSAEELKVDVEFFTSSYTLHIEIPEHCLHGFDPEQFQRIALSYRVHRSKNKPQLFSSSTQHFSLEQQPRFWASFYLK